MKQLISILIGIIVVLSLYPAPSGAADTQDEYEIDPKLHILKRPVTLQDAVDEIERMIEQEKPRWEIAKRAAIIADGRISNINPVDSEHFWLNPLFPFLLSEKDKIFGAWRDNKQGGADKQYDDQANWAWDNKIGQCSENSCLVYYLLKKAGAKNIRIFVQKDPDHAFVVWGMDEEAEPNDLSSWTNEVIVPDGWQHKVLRGSKALRNEYCGHDGKGVEDNTHFKDHSVPHRCGYTSIPSVDIWHPCCKKAPYAPCRGNPKLACIDGYCVLCGGKGYPCCEGDMCNTDTLECKEGKCVEKSKEEEGAVFPDCPPCVGSGSGLQLDAGNSSWTVNGENFSVRCTYLGSSHDLLQDETFVEDVSSSPSLRSEEIPDLSRAQDSLGNEQFVDRGHIYITTHDAERLFSENYDSRLLEIGHGVIKTNEKGEELSVVHELEMLYSIEDLENPEPVPSVYHVIVDGVFLYSERYYIEVNVEVFDRPKNAVINTFDELVGCAKAVIR